ncbi:response regulator transcription factor [Agrobacterium tumefaciens]|uniref:Response regulator transcription factor n=1 Tax=Agrobacterium tumefaciens TaxID=358 RepID=A0AAP9E6D0_AGRTU|nr:response regulator [Agrobacterium tumefaciens]NSZ59117.1 response regulator transcription factor [Agrobacterium tumefaciens]QDY95602.1 response regulator transcription factor [Agrobacterium tumefaciens]UXS45773.1 response regulator transcription factor [Agrobacterium tumefaciens]UXS73586.1 response regulator transcription factor [Agrobacterium tumefaciens]UXS79578.1 response regulator transcription factor [Agrobacterium tumefaciens]
MAELVLIAEDDMKIAGILEAYFTREGFRTVHARDGKVALELHRALKPDIVLADVSMPRLDGWEVLAEIQRRGHTPVIMVTALDKDVDRLQGLRIGADDYIVKPFNPIEVVARAKAVLRRAGLRQAGAVVRVGNLTIDLDSYEAKIEKDDATIRLSLTLTEFRLLAHLARTPTKAFTRGELVDACLPGSDALDRTIDSHLSKLRKKLEQAGGEGILASIRGVGYRLAVEP